MTDPSAGGGGFLDDAMGLVRASAGAADAEITGSSGGGVVRITASGDGEFRRVVIDPSAVDADDVELLEDLVLAAINDAMEQIGAAQRASIEQSLGGLLGGGAGGLGDLLGGLTGQGGDADVGGLGEMMSGLLGGGGLGVQPVEGELVDEEE